MHPWRARLLAAREAMKEDEEDDDFNLQWILQMQRGYGDGIDMSAHVGGSRPGRAPNIARDRQEMHRRMMRDYFSDTPVYGPHIFRRRYRIRRSLFLHIMDRVCAYDNYFVQKVDATGLEGLFQHLKITATLCMLCYGLCADATDEYCKTSESTTMESLKRFCIAVRAEFEDYHSRQPTQHDFQKQLAINETRGFPGMFGSLDWMHYEWKNCPAAWQGDFGDWSGKKSIILEAIASEDLHIWHVFLARLGLTMT